MQRSGMRGRSFLHVRRPGFRLVHPGYGCSRAIYLTASGQRVVILRVFVKKTQKTPRREIDTARERAREVK
jgi:phage-related protein